MKKNGFISISLIYTFFILFLVLMVFLLNNYSSMRFLLDQYKSDIKNEYVEWQTADINLYYMLWDDVSKNYEMSDGIPSELENNYVYQGSLREGGLSYCDNDAVLTYNNSTREFTIKANEKDRCFVYFRQNVTVNVYTRENETGQYVTARSIPGFNYVLDPTGCTQNGLTYTCKCDNKVSIIFDPSKRTYTFSSVNKGSVCSLRFTKIKTTINTTIYVEDDAGEALRPGDSRKYSVFSTVPNSDEFKMDGVKCNKDGFGNYTLIRVENGKLLTESSVDNDCSIYFVKDVASQYEDIKVYVYVWDETGYKLGSVPPAGYKFYSAGCSNDAEIAYDYQTLKIRSNGPTECTVYFRRS